MKELPPLDGLSHAEKDALIQGLWQELQTLRVEVEKLKQKRVKKTSCNSSLPPAKGFKPNQISQPAETMQRNSNVGHGEGGQELSQHPDQVVIAQAKSCPHRGASVRVSSQQLKGIYERIELPTVKPQVTRVGRYSGTCACCQQNYEAPVPMGLEPGSPFGCCNRLQGSGNRQLFRRSFFRTGFENGDLYGLQCRFYWGIGQRAMNIVRCSRLMAMTERNPSNAFIPPAAKRYDSA